MRVVLQRVARASVSVDAERVAAIGRGYLLLVGIGAGDPDGEAESMAVAVERVEAFAAALEARGVRVGRGVFGAHMEVDLVNDGPFTMVLDTSAPASPRP